MPANRGIGHHSTEVGLSKRYRHYSIESTPTTYDKNTINAKRKICIYTFYMPLTVYDTTVLFIQFSGSLWIPYHSLLCRLLFVGDLEGVKQIFDIFLRNAYFLCNIVESRVYCLCIDSK